MVGKRPLRLGHMRDSLASHQAENHRISKPLASRTVPGARVIPYHTAVESFPVAMSLHQYSNLQT